MVKRVYARARAVTYQQRDNKDQDGAGQTKQKRVSQRYAEGLARHNLLGGVELLDGLGSVSEFVDDLPVSSPSGTATHLWRVESRVQRAR